jgi:hypothetical protein
MARVKKVIKPKKILIMIKRQRDNFLPLILEASMNITTASGTEKTITSKILLTSSLKS